MGGAMDATMLTRWRYDKDEGDGCYNDKDNVKIDVSARLQRQRPCCCDADTMAAMDDAMTKTRRMLTQLSQWRR